MIWVVVLVCCLIASFFIAVLVIYLIYKGGSKTIKEIRKRRCDVCNHFYLKSELNNFKIKDNDSQEELVLNMCKLCRFKTKKKGV